MKRKILWILISVFFVIMLPVLVGVIVSTPNHLNLQTGNNWIGFWGSYIGTLLSGIITLLVLNNTIQRSKRDGELAKKREICLRTSTLVAKYCIEIFAFKSRNATLVREAKKTTSESSVTTEIKCYNRKSQCCILRT